MIGPECTSWTKGSQASDHAQRPWSRGIPSGSACFDNTKLTQLGPKRFRAQAGRGSPGVGDQFVMYSWKGMSYVVANSSAVLTQVTSTSELTTFISDARNTSEASV